MKTAVCPGSFDPITKGHMDIILRASSLFDKVIVAVMDNPQKQCLFSVCERKNMLLQCFEKYPNIEIEAFDGLLADFVKQKNAAAIVKGLRALSDFEYEFQMALINRNLFSGAETLFLPASAEYMYFSSSMVKNIAFSGGDVTEYVPEGISDLIKRKTQEKRDGKHV